MPHAVCYVRLLEFKSFFYALRAIPLLSADIPGLTLCCCHLSFVCANECRKVVAAWVALIGTGCRLEGFALYYDDDIRWAALLRCSECRLIWLQNLLSAPVCSLSYLYISVIRRQIRYTLSHFHFYHDQSLPVWYSFYRIQGPYLSSTSGPQPDIYPCHYYGLNPHCVVQNCRWVLFLEHLILLQCVYGATSFSLSSCEIGCLCGLDAGVKSLCYVYILRL